MIIALIGMFLILLIETAGAQIYTVHFICSTMNRGDQGSITFAGIPYESGQSASYSTSDYWITGNPPPPTSDWFFYRWVVMWLGSQSWVDNQYAQSTWFHLRGEAYLEADFYSPIHANNPTSPISWGAKQRITGTANQYSGQPLTVVYYPHGGGMGPPNPNGVPPFGGSGYYWASVTVNSGSWDTGWMYPTLPISLGQKLPQTYDVYACWASGSDNEVDSNVVSFTLNPASAQIAAPTLNPNSIELGQSATVTDQIFSSGFVNGNDLTGTLTVQAKKQGEGSWTDVTSQSFTSTYGYSSVYEEYGVFYDISKAWTPTETGTYEVRVVYSGNNLYLPISNPSTSMLTVSEANNPPLTPTTPEWVTTERVLHEGENTGFRSAATDPDDDNVKITFDWGDGTTDTSNWVSSGSFVEQDHSWNIPGMFEVRTRATDNHDPPGESTWSSPLEVTAVSSDPWINWAGYVVESPTQPITAVEGYWIVPEFGTDLYGNQAIWVGIGGWGGGYSWEHPLIQAGIIAITMPDRGNTYYYAFYEAVPGFNSPDPNSDHQIFPGDTMWTKVSESSTAPGKWRIDVVDVTQDWTWTVDEISTWPWAVDQTTAEWIFEPGAGWLGDTNIASSFTPIAFSDAKLRIDSTVYDMGKVGQSIDINLHQPKFWRAGALPSTSISAISSFRNFEISDTGSRPPTLLQPITSISLFSSAELHIYDSLGNHLGYNSTSGLIDFEIPDSIYFEEEGVQSALLFNPDEYTIDLVGKEDGDFHLHTQAITNETVTLDQWVNETITIDETKTYYLIHQISLQDLVNSETIIEQGYNCSISVVVVNNGNYTETFNVTAYANTTIVGTQLVTLLSGNSSTVTFTWDTAGFALGNYTISAVADAVPGETDTADNTYIDGTVKIIDTKSPIISLLSPQNKTYYSDFVALTFEVDEQVSWIGYSLDNQANVTLNDNIFISVEDGIHFIIVYANDTSGNMGSSKIVYFTVDSTYYDPWESSFIGLDGYPIVDFTVYNGNLYAAADNKLYMHDGNDWNVINASTYVLSLEPYNGKLIIGGKDGLYSYDGTNFTLILPVSTYIRVLGIYNNTLYAGTMLNNPPTFYYCNSSAENPANWHIDVAFSTILNFSGPFGSIDSFTVYNNIMYVTSGGTVFSYNGTHWSMAKTYDDVNAFLGMKVYNGKLYLATRDQGWRKPMYQGGTGFSGRVIQYDGENWTTILDHDYWIFALEAYDNKLYIGTANKIFTYNGTSWDTSFNALEDAYYAISFITFDNTIYVGMGNGYIFSRECQIAAKGKVLVLVPNEIFGQLESRLKRYDSDIDSFNLMIVNGSWTGPEDVRLQIQDAYNNHNISGCILVGDIEAAYFKSVNVHGTFIFPTDLYYMDLDGTWVDYEPDGVFDNRTDPNGVEIWVSRIRAPTNNVTLLQLYFDKNHDFYTGVLGDYDEALAYINDCEFGQTHRVEVLKNIYNETDILFLCGANATKIDYLETLRQGFETVWISCHGGPTRQMIEEDPVVWFDGNDAKMIENGSIFYLLHNCEVGRYDVEDYLAGWYIFADSNGLIALASTTVWESIDHDFFIIANNNSYIGNAFLETIKHADELAKTDPIVARNLYYGAVLIGDPFIQIGQSDGCRQFVVVSTDNDLIKTVPEFPSTNVLPFLMLATSIAVIFIKKKK